MEFEIFIPIIIMMMGLGIIGGFLAGLLGIGGGLITVPGLYFCLSKLGYDNDVIMHVAIGSSLAMIIFTGTSSALAHYKKKSVDLKIFKIWSIGIILGTILGSYISASLEGSDLKNVFASITLLIACYMFFFKKKEGALEKELKNYIGVILGVIIGGISAIMGIGGALVAVPLMRFKGVQMQRAVGTASSMGVVIAVFGTLSYIINGMNVDNLPPYSIGYVNIVAVLLVASMSMIFAKLGAKASHLINPNILHYIFSGFILLVSIYMFS